MRRAYLIETRKFLIRLATAAALLLTLGCRVVRRETRIQPSQLPPPAREASLAELIADLNARSQSIHTMSATVDLEPTAGSVYSGVIKEYHDVKGFILMEAPATIRMLGQAPVVRTDVFDMVSNGEDFSLYIPSKQKFIVGKTTSRRPVKNSLENLRPQHILEALLLPAFDSSHEKCFLEEAEDGGRRFYVIGIVESTESGELSLQCKAWFDRANLELARMQFYEPGGVYVEDVHYSGDQDFQGITYPAHIEVARPIEDYRLAITILKAVFNQPIDADKFTLAQPPGAQLVDLNAKSPQEKPSGQ